MPATATRAHPGVVITNRTGQVSLNQFTPGHDRIRCLTNQTLNTFRQTTCFGTLCCRDDCLLNFLTNTLTFFGRHFRTLTLFVTVAVLVVLTITIHVVVNQLVNKLIHVEFLDILHEVIIDFLRGLAVILLFVQARDRSDELTYFVTFQVSVNSIVVCNVPDLRITTASTVDVFVYHVKNLVTKKELNLFSFEFHNETAIVIEIATIGCRSAAPFIGVNQLHPSCKVAEKRMTQQKTDTCSHQALTCLNVNFRVHRTNKIIEFIVTLFLRFRLINNCTHVDAP